jgi:hypothetical protein
MTDSTFALLLSDPDAQAQLATARAQSSELSRVQTDARVWLAEFASLRSAVRGALQREMEAARERAQEARRVQALQRHLLALQSVAATVRRFDGVLERDDYVMAATLVPDLRRSVAAQRADASPFTGPLDDVARRCDAVSHRLDDVFMRLFGDVSADHWLCHSAVPCRPAAAESRASISAGDAVAALAALDELDQHAARLARRLVRMLLPRIAASTAAAAAVDGGLRLTAAASPASLELALAATRVLIDYARQWLPPLLFDATLAKLAPELAANTLAPLLDFGRFAEQRRLVVEFESAVHDIGLAARLADGEQRHAARLHATALEQARAALLSPSYPNPSELFAVVRGGALDREQRVAAPLNGASPWPVTAVAHRLALQICAATPPAVAVDLVTLYDCVVRLRAAAIAAVPAQALLLLADVQHVARLVRGHACAVAVVLQLRSLEQQADAVVEAAHAAQCAEIDASWATSGGASNTNDAARQQTVSRACQRIETQVARLARALADAGPRNATSQLVGRVARHASDVVSGAVLALKDIGADECTALQATLAPLATALDAAGARKLRVVVQVLPMSILDIHGALPRLTEALSRQELAHLVSAMFQQSEKRTKLLEKLAS